MRKRIFSSMERLAKGEKGAIVVFIALGMTVMVGMAGLVIDGGRLYLEKSKLQKSVDAAVLATVQEYPWSDQVTSKERGVFASNQNGVPFDTGDAEDYLNLDTANSTSQAQVTKTVNLTFAKIFGIPDPTVKATAKLKIATMTGYSGRGIVPVGIHDNKFNPLNHGDGIDLKWGDAEQGSFGTLRLSDDQTGASELEKAFKEGSNVKIKVGQSLRYEDGGKNQSADRGLDEGRFLSCGTTWPGIRLIDPPPGTPSSEINDGKKWYTDWPDRTQTMNTIKTHLAAHPDCPRLVVVPVYGPDASEAQHVIVKGFAYVFITDVLTNQEANQYTYVEPAINNVSPSPGGNGNGNGNGNGGAGGGNGSRQSNSGVYGVYLDTDDLQGIILPGDTSAGPIAPVDGAKTYELIQ